MQRTLEDEEHYENDSVDTDGFIVGNSGQGNEVAAYHGKISARPASTSSAKKQNGEEGETSSNEASATEKHDCNIRTEECQDTQEAEFTSADNHGAKGGFGSDIDGAGTLKDGDAVETERVLETQSPANFSEQRVELNKVSALVGDTMQFDDDVNVQDTEEHDQRTCQDVHVDTQNTIIEDTEAGATIRTTDLLASEVAGSWACSTVPSVHGENNSQRSRDNNEGAGDDSVHPVAESQSTPDAATSRWNSELRALSEMIGIVAPDLRGHFEGSANNCDQETGEGGTRLDSDTRAAETLTMMLKSKSGSASDGETKGDHHVGEDEDSEATQDNNPMDVDSEATQEDSLG